MEVHNPRSVAAVSASGETGGRQRKNHRTSQQSVTRTNLAYTASPSTELPAKSKPPGAKDFPLQDAIIRSSLSLLTFHIKLYGLNIYINLRGKSCLNHKKAKDFYTENHNISKEI